jgi:glycosyltransferase involved in cell wall biosynthesis
MNVVIVGNFWFPHGTASAARIRNLALGLQECGARVHVIRMAPHPPLNGAAADGTGDHEGVSYESAAPLVAAVSGWRDAEQSIPRLRSRFSDKVRWFAGLYGATPFAWAQLQRRMRRGECDLVLAYDRSAVRMSPLARLCRAHGVTSVLDVTEISEHLSGRTLNAVYWDSVVGTRRTPRLFDGLTVISAGLETLYRDRGCTRTLIVPALEEWKSAPAPMATGNPVFRLTYVGALQSRDAPEVLIEAMRRLAREDRPVTLDIVGHYEGTPRGREIARQCASDPGLARRVRLLGTLSDADLARHLASSDGLVLTRRAAPTEALSFPTRLVEYLRNGRPVFISDVGDVSRYLEDGREVVLLDPRDPNRVAQTIAAVTGRPDRGAEIGCRGREAGARAFNRTAHAARLLEFAADLRPRAAS